MSYYKFLISNSIQRHIILDKRPVNECFTSLFACFSFPRNTTQKEIQRYKSKEEILEAIKQETGQEIESIKAEKGSMMQIAMDLLYRRDGLTGVEIGRMMVVDYSTVSQGRKN